MEDTLDYYVYDFIRDTEEFKGLRARIKDDIEDMPNAIAFLKEEGHGQKPAKISFCSLLVSQFRNIFTVHKIYK